MNIFALSDSPHESAIWQHDRHVVKMILESAQMLSTWARSDSANLALVPPQHRDSLYKSTHVNHPCNIWLRDSRVNVVWLALHLDSLVSEYHRRFQKVHATDSLRWAFNQVACNIVGLPRMWVRDSERNLIRNPIIESYAKQHMPFAVCMPDEFKDVRGAVESYRNVYRESKIFQSHVKWTRCDMIPDFLFDGAPMQHVNDRLKQLVTAHRDQLSGLNSRPGTAAQASRDPHPDSLKPANPNNIKRFGFNR